MNTILMNRLRQWLKAGAVHCLIIALLFVLFSAPSSDAFLDSFLSGMDMNESGYTGNYVWCKRGVVAAKCLVLGPNNKPIWVAYNAEGDITRTIGEAINDLENASVMSADAYRAYAKTFETVKATHSEHMVVYNRDQYQAQAFQYADGTPLAKPALLNNTWSVVVRKKEALVDSSINLILHQSPLDVCQIKDLNAGEEEVVLLTDKGIVRDWTRDKEVNIGYRVAFFTAMDGSDIDIGRDYMGGFDRNEHKLWGPIEGARVGVTLGNEVGITDEDGHFHVKHEQLCPGGYTAYLWAELRYRNLNPKWRGRYGYGIYFVRHQIYESCGFFHQFYYKFPIDIAIVTGNAVMFNEARPGIGIDAGSTGEVPLTLTSPTLYTYAKPLFDNPTAPANLDLDGDGQPDDAALNDAGGVDVWLGNTNPDTDQPDLTRLADYAPDLVDRGLVKQISEADLKKTDIYLYRCSNDQLITSRKGLGPYESAFSPSGDISTDAPSPINYRLSIRGPASSIYDRNAAITYEQWQSMANIPEELCARKADHLRTGERVKVIMVNRATGYIGTVVATLGENIDSSIEQTNTGETGLLSVTPERIALRPPNLKIRAERKYNITSGITKGEDREYLIGFEGSGLVSDEYIVIHTSWYDWDGSPLPEDLPGYTGRLAKVVEENKLGPVSNQVANFVIKPGRHTQVLHLPRKALDTSHFYIHVSGEPSDRNPNFSDIGAGEGPLQYRPRRYVPIKVPIFNEEATLAQKMVLNKAMAEGIETAGEAEPIYHWIYRPEMQFSLFDLQVTENERIETNEGGTSSCPNAAPQITSSNSFLYTLLQDDLPMLEQFGPERELVFSIGGAEVLAELGTDNRLEMGNTEYLASLDADDFLAIRLYQNGDDANVLWEHKTITIAISIEDNKYPVPPGETAIAVGTTTPQGRPLIWSIKHRGDGVKVEIQTNLPPNDSGDSRCAITAADNTESGWITIRATDADEPSCSNEAALYIGCLACAADSTYCNFIPGGGFFTLASIDARFSLGKTKGGQSAGDLFLRTDEASPDLATPKGLFFSTLTRDVKARYDETGALRQVLAPQTFIDIVVINDFSYNINFYRPNDIAGESGGLYEVDASARPFVVWSIENPDASAEIYNRLKITEIKDGTTKAYEYIWDDMQNAWALSSGNGLQIKMRSEEIDAVRKNRIVTETTKDASGTLCSAIRTTFHMFPWGEEIIEQIDDPDGAALTTTTTYYEDSGMTGSYGRIESQVSPDGSWVRYHYDGLGRKITEVRSWLDAPNSALAASARTTHYDYKTVDPEDALLPRDLRQPRKVTEEIQGTVVSVTYYAYKTNDQGDRIEIVERCLNPAATYGDATNQRTARTYYRPGTLALASGRIKSVQYPDGRLDTYTYENGTYSASARAFTPGNGTDVHEIVVRGTVEHPQGIAYKTTRETSITDYVGSQLMSETHVYTGTGFERIQWTANTLDEFGRVTRVQHSDGSQTDSIWGCCAKESDTDAQGITTDYIVDDLQRVEKTIREGLNGDIITTYTYDAMGRQLTQTVSAGALSQTTGNVYDGTGHLRSTTDPAGLVTTYSYEQGGLVSTVTRPGNATEVSTRYIDGRTKSITGTGVIPRFYEYGVNADGTQWTKVSTGTSDSPRWEKTTTDTLGRTITVEKPGFGAIETTRNYYNEKGQLIKTTTSGRADILYVYDDLGNQFRTGLDIDHNGALELASNDRISETETSYTSIDNTWWQENTQRVYAEASNSAPTTVSTQRAQITGLGTNGKTQESISIDINGNQTVNRVFVNRLADTVTRVTDYPDSATDAVIVSERGLVTSAQSKTGVTITYSYDALGRRTGAIDPRTGTTTTHYNAKGRLDYIEDPAGNRTRYLYDQTTGRKIADINALNKATRYAYNTQGQVTHTWGDAAYPVHYIYDPYGQMKQMHTYRNGTGWNAETWPTDTGTADITTWHYHEATGLLTQKQDAAGRSVYYTYTTGGQLATRIWSRTDGANQIVTSYAYSPETGELLTIDYTDTTPDITFVYDRLGRQKSVTDAVGARTFAYNTDLTLQSETITGLYNNTITRTYEADGVKGRSTGFALGADYSVTYGYDDKGRFASVGWNVENISNTATYTYVPDSDLIAQLTTDNGQRTTNYTYEPHRNVRTQVQNQYNTRLISQYDYTYDALGRRTLVANSGEAFAAVTNAFNFFNYNDRNELTESSRYLGADITNTNIPVEREYRNYAYDPIGNRTQAVEASLTHAYATNVLNQYTEDIATDNGQQTMDRFTYDLDGNLTSVYTVDTGTTYTYNAENRLIAVAPQTPAEGDTKVEFIYDYVGRRIKKTVYTYTANSYQPSAMSYYVYDGWNLIQEITTDNGQLTTDKNYVFALDLSQSLQGAGGIGGLLVSVDNATGIMYHYIYDANGNVGQLINASDGAIAAHYEYDPYGNEIVASGAEAENNAYRFSAKYFDGETQLYYYGYRYYSPELGRWIYRDPIDELGSMRVRKQVEGFTGQHGQQHYGSNRYHNPGVESYLGRIPIEAKAPDVNVYAYAQSNPLMSVDPVGLFVQRCSRWVTNPELPPTPPWNPFRHDYFRLTDDFVGFHPATDNLVWTAGEVRWGGESAAGCHTNVCDDDRFDQYIVIAATAYVPTYAIFALPDSIYYQLGARNCQTWADDILERARQDYFESELCPRCFTE